MLESGRGTVCLGQDHHDLPGQTIGQVAIQLLLSGDVETNPGPPTRVTRANLPGDDRLNEGKAILVQKAPANIRLVLSLWEPGKSDIRQCMDKQFHVPPLNQALLPSLLLIRFHLHQSQIIQASLLRRHLGLEKSMVRLRLTRTVRKQ